VQVARHRVPDASALQRSQSQQQLRGLADFRVDVLTDGALIGSRLRASCICFAASIEILTVSKRACALR